MKIFLNQIIHELKLLNILKEVELDNLQYIKRKMGLF